jgi:hypothetical protein
MESAQIVREIESLPPEAQRLVVNYVVFLKTRYLTDSHVKNAKPVRLADEPFVGMWKDRGEIQNSAEWVQNLRRHEWERSA